jgi:23S rRNA pseudouridine2604 synthase
MSEPIRLAKRVAELKGCSRREAEQYIEGGWVQVDGRTVEEPQFRVADQAIEIDPHASLEPAVAVTLLLNKPPGHEAGPGPRAAVQLLDLPHHSPADRSGIRPLKRHFAQQACVTPLETGASGLVVFTQDWRIQRKLVEDAALVEHEVMVDVSGTVSPEALQRLNRSPVVDGRAMLAAKVSISRQSGDVTGLRFAIKGVWPGQIAQMCEAQRLEVRAMKRLRVGRVALSGLEPGQWRYLLAHEKF